MKVLDSKATCVLIRHHALFETDMCDGIGGWQSNKRHGFGVQVHPSGWRYEGDWFNNTRFGLSLILDLHGVCAGRGGGG